MKFGVLPPYRTGAVGDPAWMVRFAQLVEHLGFESIYVVEHVVVPTGYAERYPYAESGRMPLPDDCPIPDPLDLLAHLAGVTTTLILGTGIVVLPEHHPVQLAKRCATIDLFSGGRLRLGVGVGWMQEEIEAVGVDFATRGRRTDEAIQAMRALWTQPSASFHGDIFSFDGLVSRPQPSTAGGVPIHIGGHAPAAARRAGKFGDGFQPLGLDDTLLVDRLATMRAAAETAERDPAAIELTLGGLVGRTTGADIERASAQGADRLLLSTITADMNELEPLLTGFARDHLD